jgi:hypothetical protein
MTAVFDALLIASPLTSQGVGLAIKAIKARAMTREVAKETRWAAISGSAAQTLGNWSMMSTVTHEPASESLGIGRYAGPNATLSASCAGC